MRAVVGMLLSSLTVLLTGCALIATAPSMPVTGIALQGRVHGGQQAVVGAHVYLLQANTLGYGGAGIAASSQNASISLLKASDTGYSDSVGAYVPTASDGSFAISGDYTCTPGTQVYLYALGGNPGAGVNSAAGFLAVLGTCPAADNFATATPFIWVNEVSTVAAAYSIAGFATDALHVSSGSTAQAQSGISNAFTNAANLANLSTGVALTTTPAGNGLVPQTKIDTIANILGACVNTASASSAPCSTLFSNSLNGSITPTDTATAAINIAHSPGANVTVLCTLQGAISAPFLPDLPCTETGDYPNPADLTIALQFTGGGIDNGAQLAIDASGSVWIANYSGNSVTKLSSSGAVLSGASGYTSSSLLNPNGIAIDVSGNAWITNTYGDSVTELSTSGSVISGTGGFAASSLLYAGAIAIDASGNAWITNNDSEPDVTEFSGSGVLLSPSPSTSNPPGGYGYDCMPFYAESCLDNPRGIALDATNGVWVADSSSSNVVKLSATNGTLLGTASGGGIAGPAAVAIDASGGVWVANASGSSVTAFTGAGTSYPGSPYSGNSLYDPSAIAIDGAGDAWMTGPALSNVIVTELSNAGSFLSGSRGYTAPYIDAPSSIAIDISGNVWVGNGGPMPGVGGYGVTEFVGAAAPVVTPIAAGVKNNTLGTRP